MSGGEGDDADVWNNGDGSDNAAGDAGFDRLEVNGSPTGGDWFELVPNGTDADFVRTNLVPFTVTLTSGPAELTDEPLGGIEAVSANGAGGGDLLTVSPGLPGLLVAADGGSGNDGLTGAEEADSFFGGSGHDVIDPGAGSDLADGEDGLDTLLARDNTGDLVRGGTGDDAAVTDEVTVDAISGVEALDATPPPAPVVGDTDALLPKLGKVKVLRSNGKLVARAALTCPAAESGGCRTTVTLRTARAVRLGAVRGVLVLGSKTIGLEPGQRSLISIRLARGAAALAKRGTVRARARIASQDEAGNDAVRSLALGLRIPSR